MDVRKRPHEEEEKETYTACDMAGRFEKDAVWAGVDGSGGRRGMRSPGL